MTDWQLLQQYVREGSHDAFKSLAQRHVDWIYAAAKRQVHDAHLASNVTQAVFVVLARKAASISQSTSLSGWLFRTTRYCAMDAKKMDARRRYHERHAAMERTESIELESMEWREVTPQLDEAVARLSKRDREAIVLRFYRDQSMSEIAAATGVSEEAAKKRVARAVEKLRKALARRGVKEIGALAIASGLSAAIAEKAPAQLVQSVSSAAGTASAAATQIASGAMNMMIYAKLKLVALVMLAIVFTPALVMLVHGAVSKPNQASTTQSAQWPDAAAAPDGPVLVCMWEALVQKDTADAIVASGKAIPGAKSEIPLLLCPSEKVMNLIVAARKEHTFPGLIKSLNWLEDGKTHSVSTSGIITLEGASPDGRRAPMEFSGSCGGFYSLLQNKEMAHLQFDGSLTVYLSQSVNANFSFGTDLHHGDCVLLIANVGGTPSKGEVRHLLIFQAVQVANDDAAWVRKIVDVPQWVDIGLEGALRVAKDVADWNRGAGTSSPEVIERWTHELPNGAKARLVAIGKFGEMTYRFWDPEGTPLKTQEGWVRALPPEQRPPEMLAVVEFTLPKSGSTKEKQFEGMRNTMSSEITKSSGPLTVEFGIAGGEWKDVGTIKQGETKAIAGGTFKLREVKRFTERSGSFPGRTVVIGDFTDLPDLQFGVAGVDKKGNEEPADNGYAQSIGRPSGNGIMATQIPIGMSELDHIVLRTRQRQWTRFENVAKEPTFAK